MTFQPKDSFIVPAYNEERLLPLTLRAITEEINRTNCHAEIIVVDDGSTDSTANVARTFQLVTVIQTPRSGLVNTRGTNKGTGYLFDFFGACPLILLCIWYDR